MSYFYPFKVQYKQLIVLDHFNKRCLKTDIVSDRCHLWLGSLWLLFVKVKNPDGHANQ